MKIGKGKTVKVNGKATLMVKPGEVYTIKVRNTLLTVVGVDE